MARLAAVQHGVVAHRQLRVLGFSAEAIKRRARRGRLHRIHKGVYAVGHTVLTRKGRGMAAVLACGPGAALSHRSGGALWSIRESARTDIDVTAHRHRSQHPGITVHRPRRMLPQDLTQRDGIPVTTIARTLLDLAEVVTPRELKRAFEEAERQELFDLGEADELLARSNGRRGRRQLARTIAAARPLPFTRSDFERDFLDFCREIDLPQPATNLWVAGYEIDCLWPDRRLAVELDGRTWHEARAAMESDRIKDADLHLAGYPPLRITHHRFRIDRPAVEATLRALYFRNPS